MKILSCLKIGVVLETMLIVGCITVGPTKEERVTRAVDRQREMLKRYVADKKFGNPLPKLEGRELDEILGDDFTPGEKADVQRRIKAEVERSKKETVFPAWITFKNDAIRTEAMKLVEEARAAAATNGFAVSRAKFESAREIAWRQSVDAKLDGVLVPEVNDAVRKESSVLLDGSVNVAEWPVIEREMRLIAAEAVDKGNPTNGIVRLKAYRAIRTYTSALDDKVAALVGELARLGVPRPVCTKITEQTVKFMNSAARLTDSTDTTRTVTTKAEAPASPAIDESVYRQLLAEYKDALLLYDCTNENTTKMIDWLARRIAELIAQLPRPEAPKDVVSVVIDKLGATAVNARMNALRDELVADLEKVIKENEKIVHALRAKLDEGHAEDARSQVIALLGGESKADASARAIANYELLTRINPALWKKISDEIRAKTEEFAAGGKCADGIAWLHAYPYVRTYPEEIDAQFAEVRSAAVGLGIPEETSRAVMDEVAKLAAEAEHLACYVDEVQDKVLPGKKVDARKKAQLESQLAACRDVLTRNGCTDANADKLIQTIRERFAGEIAQIEADRHEAVQLLGSNALNRRLRKLKFSCAYELVGRCTSDLIAAGKFDEARKMLRSIPLSGCDEFDAKVYAARIGAINTLVNPVQLKTLLDEADKQIDSYWKDGDFRALKKWLDDYPYVHETYPDIIQALDAVKQSMVALAVAEPEAGAYVEKLNAQISSLIESAKGTYAQDGGSPDLTKLEEALGALEKAVLAQYFDRKTVQDVIASIRKRFAEMVKKDVVSMTVCEMNAKLRAEFEANIRARIAADAAVRPARFGLMGDPVGAEAVQKALLDAAKKGMVALSAGKSKNEILTEMSGGVSASAVEWVAKLCDQLNVPKEQPTVADSEKLAFDELLAMLVKRQEYLEFLAAMDKDVAYDSQIAMAEDAIAKQLGKMSCEAKLHMNAVLGEYARAMRLLKQGKKLNEESGSALVLGSVYLDQPAVFDRAIELGAAVDGVNSRDPLRRTGLLLAVQLGRVAFVHRLVAKGADVTAVDANKDGAVHYAVRRGNISVLNAMVMKNDVNARNAKGETALFDAARSNQPALVEALVTAKADVALRTTNGVSAFDAACKAGSRDVLDALASAGSEYGPAQLIIAAENGRLAVAQWLVAKGVDVNAPGVMAAAKNFNDVNPDSKNVAKNANPVLDFLLHQGGILTDKAVPKSAAQ